MAGVAGARLRCTGSPRRLEELDVDTCWELLATQPVGRVAINRRGRGPLVVPVLYRVEPRRGIVYRTGVGTKLARVNGGSVSFQVDAVDEAARTGWSVLLEGLAHEVDLTAAAAIEPWMEGRLDHAVRIVADRISGRRLVPVG